MLVAALSHAVVVHFTEHLILTGALSKLFTSLHVFKFLLLTSCED